MKEKNLKNIFYGIVFGVILWSVYRMGYIAGQNEVIDWINNTLK